MASRKRVLALLAGLALCIPAALPAQQKQKDPRVNPPLAPVGESSSRAPEGAVASGTAAAATASEADRAPLTGAEMLSLASFGNGHTYLLPSFSVTSGSDWSSGRYTFHGNMRGGIALHRDTGYNQMSLNYSTGALFSGGAYQAQAHSLAFQQHFRFRRWDLMVADTFAYLPESAFGFSSFSGIGTPNVGGQPNWSPGNVGGSQSSFDPFFLPDQTILSGNTDRISNTVIGQGTSQLTPRVSMTFTGAYGLLRFLDPGFVESDNTSLRAGLNYALNARDSLGFSYGSSMIRFSNDADINNHVLQFFYGRRLTGRLALRVGAGPSFVNSFDPLTGSNHRRAWSGSANLIYSAGRSTFGLGYGYQTTGGSGVQVGAQTHFVNFQGGSQLSRMWTLGGSGGYAHNTGLQELNLVSVRRTFNTWYAGLDLGRPLGRYSRLSFRYQASRQSVSCPVTALTCTSSTLRHQFGVNVDFSRQFNPIELN